HPAFFQGLAGAPTPLRGPRFVPTSLAPCWVKTRLLRVKTHAAPSAKAPQAAAPLLGLQQLIIASARTESDLETAFATFSQQRVGAVLWTIGTASGAPR